MAFRRRKRRRFGRGFRGSVGRRSFKRRGRRSRSRRNYVVSRGGIRL